MTTKTPAKRATKSADAHQSPISYADLMYELKELEDCLNEAKDTDIYAAKMICKTLLLKLRIRSPYIRMPLA